MLQYFITGVAGFVGFHLSRVLLNQGHQVIGYDGMTNYYDPKLKKARIAQLEQAPRFSWKRGMLEDARALDWALEDAQPDVIIHLAAQAGVRYSLEAPLAYVDANLVGTYNVLEAAKRIKPSHLMLASTSSVYGGNQTLPFKETDSSHFPMSLYAATKKSMEAMSHGYSHLYDIPTTNFRFFTVYGPWGRPDMALFKFVDSITHARPIEIYGHGQMSRDFTYIDDLVEAIARLAAVPPERGKPVAASEADDSLSPVAPWRIVNLAGGRAIDLMDFVKAIERKLGVEATKEFLPMQPGDVVATRADATLLKALTGYQLLTEVEYGVSEFVDWYHSYYLT